MPNRTSMFGTFRTLALVTVVALLVWVWAEGESLTDEQASIRLELVCPADADLVLLPADGAASTTAAPTNGGFAPPTTGAIAWSVGVLITLEGATDDVTRAEAESNQKVLRLAVGMPGVPRLPGASQTINVLEALRAHPEARLFAGVLVKAEPELIPVNAIGIVSRELPVRADPLPGLETDGDPTPARSTVTIRVPESLAASLNDQSVARVGIDEAELPRLREEGVRTITAKVRPPVELEAELAAGTPGAALARLVRMQPDTMGVTVRVRRSVESVTLRSVPVWLSMPPDQIGKWNVMLLDDILTDVTLSGPREAIQRVQSPDAPVKATVELTWDDLERAVAGAGPTGPGLAGTATKQAVIGSLPAGVTASVQNTTVRVRVERRVADGRDAGEGDTVGPSPLEDAGDSVE